MFLERVVMTEYTMKVADNLNIIADQFHPEIETILIKNGGFQQSNIQCYNGSICIGVVPET